jgi:hypothetical protein
LENVRWCFKNTQQMDDKDQGVARAINQKLEQEYGADATKRINQDEHDRESFYQSLKSYRNMYFLSRVGEMGHHFSATYMSSLQVEDQDPEGDDHDHHHHHHHHHRSREEGVHVCRQ